VAIRVAVEEAFLHCAKALKRSKLWDPQSQLDRRILPSLGRMILEQTCETAPDEATVTAADANIEQDYKTGLY